MRTLNYTFIITFTLTSMFQGTALASGGPIKDGPIKERSVEELLSDDFVLQNATQNEQNFVALRTQQISELMLSKSAEIMGVALAPLGGDCGKSVGKIIGDTAAEVFSIAPKVGDEAYACEKRLFSVSLVEELYQKETNVDKYCECVDQTSKEQGIALENDKEKMSTYNRSFYSAIIANRIYSLLDFIGSNQSRLEYRRFFEPEEDLSKKFTCTSRDAEKISQKIKNCFDPGIVLALQKKTGYAFRPVLTKDDEKTAKDYLDMSFKYKSREFENFTAKFKEENGFKLGVETDYMQVDFGKTFLVDLPKYQRVKDLNNIPDSFIKDVRKYIAHDIGLMQEYYAFRSNEIDTLKTMGQSLYYASEGKRGSIDLSEDSISRSQEDRMISQFAFIYQSKFLATLDRTLGNDKGIRKLMKRLGHSGSRGRDELFAVHQNYHMEARDGLVSECEQQISELERVCNEDMAEVLKSVSAVEFTDANKNFGGQSIQTAKYYCDAIDRGEVSKAVAIGSGGVFNFDHDSMKTFKDAKRKHQDYLSTSIAANEATKQHSLDVAAVPEVTAETKISVHEKQYTESLIGEMSEQNHQKFNEFNNQNMSQQQIDTDYMQVTSDQNVVAQTPVAQVKVEKIKEEESLASKSVSSDSSEMDNGLNDELTALRAQIKELNAMVADSSNPKKPQGLAKPKTSKAVISNEQSTFVSNGARNGHLSSPSNSSSQSIASSGGASSGVRAISSGASSIATAASSLALTSSQASGLALASANKTTFSVESIDNQDQKLVNRAISQGNSLVTLADGNTYFIGLDEEGNVILSASEEDLMKVAINPELEGPQVPSELLAKVEVGAQRSIASETIDVSSEGSIYNDFLNAAEITE